VHRWCNGCDTSLELVNHWIKLWLGQTKD